MKNLVKVVFVLSFTLLFACSNKAALKDSSNADYKTSKETPGLVLPSDSTKKTKRY